jgi:hypothetical protein
MAPVPIRFKKSWTQPMLPYWTLLWLSAFEFLYLQPDFTAVICAYTAQLPWLSLITPGAQSPRRLSVYEQKLRNERFARHVIYNLSWRQIPDFGFTQLSLFLMTVTFICKQHICIPFHLTFHFVLSYSLQRFYKLKPVANCCRFSYCYSHEMHIT